MTRAAAVALALVLAALLASAQGAASPAQATTLFATVGPGFSIALRDAQGNRVTRLAPGTYEIRVDDRSDVHNFRLTGPGVDERTDVEGTGTVTWTVTLREGTYRYVCEPHADSMRGSFTVGAPTQQPPPGVVTPGMRLVLTSGPGFSITLRTAAGRAVRTLQVGTYTVTVRDRSRTHNARLVAPGFRRATSVPFVGTQRWRVALRRPGTLRFLCDPHASGGMRGSARIVR
ncbi:MAG TPA: plastocyanin/azurin family copper-binding protein [Gaiellaceae bacterium]|nr:plastocyanin/azurin family copper-binding protein [Gaiellaceae bacterium]